MNPPDPHPAVPHELLLGQAGFLRRLARDLVRDPHAAEDALQDTWVAALEHPPRHGGNVRAWLGTILRNLVAKRAGSRDRRTHHELRAGREGAGNAAPGSSGESVRAVTDAVLALEEPYRSTILARYFDELSPTEIAKQQSVPVTTVKSRLRRALEMLRANLERERGSSWANGFIALAWPNAAAHSIPIGAATKGVLAMTLKTKLTLGCVVLLCALLVYWSIDTPRPDESTAIAGTLPSSPARTPAEVTSQVQSPHEEDQGERVQAKPDPTLGQGEASIEPVETSFYGSLLGPDGKLLAGLSRAGVMLTDSAGVGRLADANQTGSFVFQALPYGTYWVYAFADGFVRVLDVIELDAAHVRIRRDFTFKPCATLKIQVITPEGASLIPEQRELEQPKSADDGEQERPNSAAVLVPVATIEPPGEWFTETVGRLDAMAGIGHFSKSGIAGTALPKDCLGALTVDHELPAYVSLVNFQRVLQTQHVRPGANEVVFTVSQEELSASMASVRLKVVDSETLAPVPRAAVDLRAGMHAEGLRLVDSNGCAAFEGCMPGEADLHVSAKGYEDFWSRVRVEPGVATDLGQIALDRALDVEVHVVDEAGAPHPARLSIGALDAPGHGTGMSRPRACSADDAGVLRLEGLGRRLYVVRVSSYDRMNWKPSEGPEFLPACSLLDLRSGKPAADLKITLVPATRVTVLVGGDPGEGLRLRITDEQGIELVSSNSRYSYGPRPFALPPGKYTLALLDANQHLLKQQPMVVGSTPLSVELSR